MAGTPISLTPFQAHVDSLVGNFTQQAFDWKSLAALSAAGMAYRAGRIGAMGLGSGDIFRGLSAGAGLVSEVSTFEWTHRALHPQNSNLWKWSGPSGLKTGLAGAFITFGSLRGAGKVTQGENLLVQHLFQDTGMVLAHQASGSLGLGPRPRGSLAEQFLHAEATTLQIGAGMALTHSFAPSLSALEKGLDLSLKMQDGGMRISPSLLGSPALLAVGAGSEGAAPETARPSKGADLYYMAGRSDISYPGLKTALPTTFKNGELFSAKNGRIPEGLPMIYVPESKNSLKAEDAITQTVAEYLNSFRRRGRPDSFMVVYLAKGSLDPKKVKELLQRHIGTSFPENFLVVVANLLGVAAGAVLYKQKREKLEIDSWTTIRSNLPAPVEPKTDVASPASRMASPSSHSPNPPSTIAGGSNPGDAPMEAPAFPRRETGSFPALSNPKEREVETRPETLPRSQNVADVSEAADSFRRLLELLNERKDSTPGSWFIEISKPFIEVKPQDLELLTQGGALFDPSLRSVRTAIHESILRQIQAEVVDRLSSILRRNPIPQGQIVHIKWKEPLSGYLKFQEENGMLQASVSGNSIPARNQAMRRDELHRNMTLDFNPRPVEMITHDSSPILEAVRTDPAPWTPPPADSNEPRPSSFTAFGHLSGFLDPKKPAGDQEPILIDCNLPSEILENLGSLLDSQRGKFLPARPIQMGLAVGKVDRDFLSSLLDFLKDHPPLYGQEIQIKWDTSSSYLKAWNREGQIGGEISEPLAGGIATFQVVLKPDGTKNETSHYSSGNSLRR